MEGHSDRHLRLYCRASGREMIAPFVSSCFSNEPMAYQQELRKRCLVDVARVKQFFPHSVLNFSNYGIHSCDPHTPFVIPMSFLE